MKWRAWHRRRKTSKRQRNQRNGGVKAAIMARRQAWPLVSAKNVKKKKMTYHGEIKAYDRGNRHEKKK